MRNDRSNDPCDRHYGTVLYCNSAFATAVPHRRLPCSFFLFLISLLYAFMVGLQPERLGAQFI